MRGVDQVFKIRPENMELGFLYIAEIIFTNRKGKQTGTAQGHQQTGCERDPGKFKSQGGLFPDWRKSMTAANRKTLNH